MIVKSTKRIKDTIDWSENSPPPKMISDERSKSRRPIEIKTQTGKPIGSLDPNYAAAIALSPSHVKARYVR